MVNLSSNSSAQTQSFEPVVVSTLSSLTTTSTATSSSSISRSQVALASASLDCSRNAATADSSSPSSTISSLSSLSAASSSLNLNHRESSSRPQHQNHHHQQQQQSQHHHHHNHHNQSSSKGMSRNVNNNSNMNPSGHHHPTASSVPPGSNPQANRSGQAPYHHPHSAGGQQSQSNFNNQHHHHHQSSSGHGGQSSHHYYQGNNQGATNRPNPSMPNAPHQSRSNMHHNNNSGNNNNHHHHNPNQAHHHNHHPQQPHPRSQQQQQHPHGSAGGGGGGSQASSASADAGVDAIDFHILETIEYPFCTDHSKYEHIAKIGQGTFGEVYKAKCKKTQELVALKKVLTENEKEGFPITALREIKILQVLRHENIVRLIEICTTKATQANKYKSNFYLVFEFCEHDLAGLLSNPLIKFSLGEQKKIMHQLLNGLYYIHKNYILHRDMKTANILVTKDGKLKLADFGLARAVEQKSDNQAIKYTNRVVTLWYRPPELLLGERCYTRAIDMWGAGCIMAELWTKEPILKGNSEQTQLDLIQMLCGSIDTSVWPDVDKLELFNKMQLKPDLKRKVKERLGHFIKDQCALNLLDKLLTLDPRKRIDSDEALDDDFFWSDPMPTDLKLDKLSTSNFEFTAQNNRRGQMHRPITKQVGNEQYYDKVY